MGKKSDKTFAVLLTTTVDKITVSPYHTNTAPSACLATSPCSTTNFFPLKSNSNTFFINYLLFLFYPIDKIYKKRQRHYENSAYQFL